MGWIGEKQKGRFLKTGFCSGEPQPVNLRSEAAADSSLAHGAFLILHQYQSRAKSTERPGVLPQTASNSKALSSYNVTLGKLLLVGCVEALVWKLRWSPGERLLSSWKGRVCVPRPPAAALWSPFHSFFLFLIFFLSSFVSVKRYQFCCCSTVPPFGWEC